MRTPILLLVLTICGASLLPAQLAPGVQAPPVEVARWIRGELPAWGTDEAPALTLFGVWEAGSEDFLENTAYYAELQRRYAGRGLRVAGVLYGEADPEVPDYADFAIGVDPELATSKRWVQRDRQVPGPIVWLVDGAGEVVWRGSPAMGLAGDIERILQSRFSAEEAQRRSAIRFHALEAFADTQPPGQIAGSIDAVLDYNPLDGLGWALRFAYHVERVPDPRRALAVAKDAFAALTDHSAPMGLFADRALRTDPHNVQLARLAVPAMTPLAPLAEGDLRFQLAWLRALQRAGNHRQAGLLSRQLAKTFEDRPARLLEFVEVLADAPEAAVNADTARRALELAEKAGVDGKLLTGARFKFLDRCLGDRKAALGVAERWMAELGSRSAINNSAWYLMVNEPTRGRFNGLARVMCDRLLENRGAMDYFEFDTAALGIYLGGGPVERAIELQETAIEKSGGAAAKPAYVERLKRFEAARRRGEAR